MIIIRRRITGAMISHDARVWWRQARAMSTNICGPDNAVGPRERGGMGMSWLAGINDNNCENLLTYPPSSIFSLHSLE